ncbi:MAG: NAD(P)-dependent oxidoreductase, partial [Desulfobulbales bacterium]
MSSKIGFIGLGIMGQPMAANVLKAGYELMVYNRTEEKTHTLAEAGALVATNPAELSSWADIIILMLTGPEAIDNVLYAEKGILAANPTAKTIINMSTVPPAYNRTLASCLKPNNNIF